MGLILCFLNKYINQSIIITGSRRLPTYETYDCSTLRPMIRPKDDYNIITRYIIGKVIIT